MFIQLGRNNEITLSLGMKKIYLLIAFSFALNPISAQVFCGVFSSQIQYKKDSAFFDSVPKIRVEVIVLDEDHSDSCNGFLLTPKIYKRSVCSAEKEYPLTRFEREVLDSTDYHCFPTRQFTSGPIVRYKFYTYVPLSDITCASVQFYTATGRYVFDNTKKKYTPISSSLETYISSDAIHDYFVMPDVVEDLRVEQACLGKYKEIWVTDTMPFSFYKKIEVVKPTHHSDSKSFEFDSTLSTAKPIPSINFSVNKGSISFIPTETGLFIIPVKTLKHSINRSFGRIYEQNVQYKNLVVYVSDFCDPTRIYSQTFADKEGNYLCDSIYKIPLRQPILKSSISPDGTDLKFHHPQNFPVVIDKAYGTDHDPLYTDTLILEGQFYFDGQYRVQVVAGFDGDRMRSICGFELQNSPLYKMNLSNCANQIGLREESAPELKIYPQPADQVLKIEASEKVKSYKCYAFDGQLLMQNIVYGKRFEANTGRLSAGAYLLQLELETGDQITKRFTVQ